MRLYKVKTAAQCFWMSCVEYSGHGNSIHNIISLFKKVKMYNNTLTFLNILLINNDN